MRIPWPCRRALVCLVAVALVTTSVAAQAAPPSDNGPAADFPIHDIHVHVFNAGYLPLKGIFIARGVPKIVASLLADFLIARARFSDFTRDRDELLAADFTNVLALSEEEAEDLIFEMADMPDLTSRQRRKLRRYLAAELREMDVDLQGLTDQQLIGRTLETARLDTDAGSSYFRFLALLLQNEVTIVQTLKSEYPVDRFLHHMMDLGRTYNDRPKLDFHSEQISRMESLATLFPDELLGFVAFDPFRRDRALSVVQAAIDRGAVGVKFYPPSGYRASGNEIPKKPPWYRRAKRRQWKSRYKGLDGKDLDAINESLFAYCEARGIPLLTHCTPKGFEADSDYGEMSNPDFWEPVLTKYPDLIVAFGHAGGGDGWFSNEPWDLSNPKTFDEKVYALVTRFDNAYLGFGYADEILDPQKKTHFRQRLIDLLGREGPPPRLGDKIMYGTDWHMVSTLNARRRLLTEFLDLFNDPALRPWRERFFAENAKRFLNRPRASTEP